MSLKKYWFYEFKNPGWKPSCTVYILALPWKQRRIDMSHQPHSTLRHLKKLSFSRGLVKMSASCSFVKIYLILMSPSLLKDVCTLLWKWWYLIAICFVQGVNFKDSAIAIAIKLSSWHVIQKSVIEFGISKMQLISLTRFWTGIVSIKAWDIAIYSASAVDNAISVWSLLHHTNGQNSIHQQNQRQHRLWAL